MVKQRTQYRILERLVKWEYVKEVNNMIMTGMSPRKVAVWCCEHGFEISDAKLYEYKQLLQTAIGKQVTVDRLIGINAPRQNPIMSQVMMETDAKNLVKNELEVIDVIIQKGFNIMRLPSTEIKPVDVMKAIELKHKLTGGSHGMLTNYGLDQLRELEKAKMEAIVEVVANFLPPDKQDELYYAITRAERKFYKENAPEMLEEYDEMIQETMNDDSTSEDIIVEEEVPMTLGIEDTLEVIDLIDPDQSKPPLVPFCNKCNRTVRPKNTDKLPTRCPNCGSRLTLIED